MDEGPGDRADHAGRLTAPDEVLGTPAYAAPEQLRGERPTTKSDLYAWGLMFFECLLGHPAIEGLSAADIHYQQLSERPIKLPSVLEQHPLGAALRWVLDKSLDQRASEASLVFSKLESLDVSSLVNAEGFLQTETSGNAPIKRTEPTEDIALGPRGERRPLTTLCCRFDFQLSDQGDDAMLDPLLQELRTRVEEVVRNGGGKLASFVGAQAVAVFGFPQATERNTRQAARVALELQGQLGLRKRQLKRAYGIETQLRIGIHQGLISLRGDETTAEQLTGGCLIPCAQLAELASPNDVLLSAEAHAALSRHMLVQPSELKLCGVLGKPTAVHRLVGEHDKLTDTQSSPSNAPTLLGRTNEIAQLNKSWAEVASGKRQNVWISGIAGSGKTRLVSSWRREIAPAQYLQAECKEQSQQTALKPVIEMLSQALGLSQHQGDAAREQFVREVESLGLPARHYVPLLAPWFRFPPGDYTPLRYAPQRQRELGIEALAALTLSLLGSKDALLIVEDAQWMDASTSEWLTLIFDKSDDGSKLIVVTSRPKLEPACEALRSACTTMPVKALSDQVATKLVELLCGEQRLERSMVAAMVARADGVPLFLEELTRFVLSNRILGEKATASSEIPHSLRELLQARLDQIGQAKETARLASVLGRQFELRLLEEVSAKSDASVLADVEQLSSAGLLYRCARTGSPTFAFHHALVHSAAYEGLLPKAREQIHCSVASALESPASDSPPPDPQAVAQHWALGGQPEKAAPYCAQASMALLMQSAHSELVAFSEQSSEWMQRIADDKARRHSLLDLTVPHMLGLMSTRGWAEAQIKDVVANTHRLLEASADYPRAFDTLFIVAIFYHSSGMDRQRPLKIARDVALLAEASPPEVSRVHQMLADVALLNCHAIDANFAECIKHIQNVIDAYDPTLDAGLAWRYGFDPLASACVIGCFVSWLTGEETKSRAFFSQAQTRANELQHPETLALVLMYDCVLGYFEDAHSKVAAAATRLAEVASEHSLKLFTVFAQLYEAWAKRDAQGVEACVSFLELAGQYLGFSCHATIVAELKLHDGNAASALHWVDRAIKHARETKEKYWLPRALCIRAQALLALDSEPETASLILQEAVELANSQGADSWKLQALVQFSRHVQESEPAQFANLTRSLSGVVSKIDASTQPYFAEAEELLKKLSS